MSSEGLLLVLSGPSGAGKTTLARRLVAAIPEARFSVSVTTRAPRGRERDGVDYHFVPPGRFDELARQGAFAEWAEVHGRRYGTLRATVEEALGAGRIAIFDIDVQGGAAIRSRWPDATVCVFVVPPSPAVLEQRLRSRSTDSGDGIRQRLAAARREVASGSAGYDYLVVNDILEEALACIRSIAAHERARRGGRSDPAAAAVAERCRPPRADLSAWLR